jgi:hypothetical protein
MRLNGTVLLRILMMLNWCVTLFVYESVCVCVCVCVCVKEREKYRQVALWEVEGAIVWDSAIADIDDAQLVCKCVYDLCLCVFCV